MRERFFLVSLFFSQEAARTGIPIRVSKNMLEYLVLFESESNIGDLKNEVILSSAYSYLEAKKSGHPEKMKELLVDSNTGSRRARSEQLKPEIRRMLSQFIPEDGWMFYPGEDAPSLPDDPPREQRNPGTYEFKPETYSQEDTNEYLFNYISPDIYAIANDLILEATQEFHEFYAKNIGNSLAFFLQQVKSYARVGRGLMEHANSLTEQRYSREIEFVQRKREELQQRLETELTEGELMSIAFLLGQRAVESQKNIGMVVAAYGEQIATGLADLVTRIFPDTPITALDYPLNTGFEVLKESVLEALQHADNGRGVILCSDISTLISREAELSALSNTECRIIPTVNTAMLLELAKDVCMTDLSLGELKQQISEEYRGYVRALFEPAAAMPLCKESVRTEKRGVIITYCITGTGSAKIARSLLLEQPEINAVADVIPMGIMSDLDSAAQQLGNRLRLVVGFLDPHIPNVPFVGLDSLFTQEGLQRILLYLQDWDAQDEEEDVPEDLSREEQLAIVEKNIPFFAPSLAADQVADSAGKVLSAILSRYKGKLEKDFAVRVYIHVIAMFERLATMEELAFSPQKKQEIAPYRSFFLWLYQILEDACRELGLALNETEVYYLMIVLPNPETGEEFLLK